MAYRYTAEGDYGSVESVIHSDAFHGDFVSIPDAELLFKGALRHVGPDLVLTGQDGRHLVIPGYFASEHHATLVAPNGARLTADLVDLLAGSPTPGEYAQAQPTAPLTAIGRVEKVVGNVTAIRNGVSVTLNVGDAVYRSDVVQTGSQSTVGISFPDGTALNLVADTRMALNEYVYDENGTANRALISLIEGTFSFVAGKVAHTGDMRIATPVATMGIRGTSGWVEEEVATVTATVGNVTYSFAVVDGVYDLIGANGNVLATVGDHALLVSVNGLGQVTSQPLTPAELAFGQTLMQELSQFAPTPISPPTPPNPQSNPSSPGSSQQPPNEQNQQPLEHFVQTSSGTTFTAQVANPNNPGGPAVDVTVTVNTVPPPTVTVAPLPPDQLTTAVFQTTSHSLPAQVLINNESTSYVPNSAVITAPPGVPSGLVTVDAQGDIVYNTASFEFLSQGEQLQYTISFQVQQGLDVAEEQLTLTIVGANEPPVFAASNTAVQFTEPANPAGPTPALNVAVALAFTDPNLDDTAYTIAVTGVTATGHVQGLPDATALLALLQADGVTKNAGSTNGTADVTFAAPQGSFEYLSQGETVTLDYTVQVTDPFGATSTQTVAVTIVGANEAPEILPLGVPDPGPIQAPAGTPDPNNPGHFLPLVESNNFTFTDPNVDDTHTVTVSFDAAQSNVTAGQAIGQLTATLENDSTGGNQGEVNWQFTVDPELVNTLAPGAVLREVFDVTVTDDNGASAVKEVVVTIDGPTSMDVAWTPTSPSPPHSSGNWNTATDWSSGVVPGAGDTVEIGNPVKVTIDDSESVGGLTIAAGAIVDIVDGGTLAVSGTALGGATIGGAGTVALDSSDGSDPSLAIAGTVTLLGGGTIAMEGTAADNTIVGVAGTSAELLNLDDAIVGAGMIGQGDDNLTFVNDGTVNATGIIDIATGANTVENTGNLDATLGGTLNIESSVDNTTGTVDADGATVSMTGAAVTNTAFMEATNGGTLSFVDLTVTNAGGTIAASSYGNVFPISNSQVNLDNVTIIGGVLETTSWLGIIGSSPDYTTGIIQTIANSDDSASTSVFDGVANNGYVEVGADTTLVLRDTIDNAGTITLAASSTGANLAIDGTVTLEGSGNIGLLSSDDVITGAGGSARLINDGNVIAGNGTVEVPFLTNEGGGTIEATGGTVAVSGAAVTNTSLMEAVWGGTLALNDTTVTNAGGTLQTDAASTIMLSATTLVGGTVANFGQFQIAGDSTVENAAVSGGEITVANAVTLTLDGASIDGSTINLAPGGVGPEQSISEISAPSLTGLEAYAPAMSADGEFVAFTVANGLPGQQTSGFVALYDTANSQLTDISALVPAGDLHAGESFIDSAAISATGQFIVFQGDYSTQNGTASDVFLYNNATQQVTLVRADAGDPSISGDGASIATEGSIGQGSGVQILVMNDSGQVETVIGGDPNNNGENFGDPDSVYGPSISSDGRYVTFWTTASEITINGGAPIATGDSNGTAEVYIYDRAENTLQMVSVNDAGHPGNADSGALSTDEDGGDWPSSMSADGRFVVFQSSASNLVAGAGDANGDSNIFVYDTLNHTIQLVSVAYNGAAANADSIRPEISADGRYVTFASDATNLVPGGTPSGVYNTYIYDTLTGTIQLVSANADDTPADNNSGLGSTLSDDGAIVAFGSAADNLVPGTDNTGNANIYVVDLKTTPAGAVDMVGDTAISNTSINNGQFTIESGVTATLDNVTFAGSTLVDDGIIQVDSGDTLTFAGTNTVDGGAIVIDNNGSIVHAGTLLIGLSQVTYEGSGTVTFNGDTHDSGALTLINDGNTFEGSGRFGDGLGSLTLINNANGIIDANVAGSPFVIGTGNTVTNAGLMEATDGATLAIANTTIDNAGGVISAAGAGSAVQLSAATIEGGTLTTDNLADNTGGEIEIVFVSGPNTSVFDGSTEGALTVDGYVQVDSGANLQLEGTINNEGTINVDGADTDLLIDGDVTLDGGGMVTLGTATDEITGAPGGGTLDNVDNTISGSGQIGTGDELLTFDNESGGAVDATGFLVIETGDEPITNAGLLEATGGGTLDIDSQLSNSGKVGAVDGGTVQIDAEVVNDGGMGAFLGGTMTFDHSRVDNNGGGSETDSPDGIGAHTDGTVSFEYSHVVNDGLIAADTGGSVTFEHSHVVNNENIGTGTVGAEPAPVGTVTFDHSHVDNDGQIQAGNNGAIDIDNSTIDNGGGTIGAGGTNSSVQLSDATIQGGTLVTDDSTSGDAGVVEIVSPQGDGSNTTIFDGDTDGAMTIGAFVNVDAGASLELVGTIDLSAGGTNGTINVDGPSSGADLVIDGTVQLEGSGAVTLQGNSDEITGTDSGELDNSSSIIGAGQIGTGGDSVQLVNEASGVINADNASDDGLVINTGRLAVINHGLMEATGDGELDIASNLVNSNMVEADDAKVDVAGSVSGSGAATIKDGGFLEFGSGVSADQNVSFVGAGAGTLALSDPAAFSASISGLVDGDTIDLTDIAPSAIVSATIEGLALVVDETGGTTLTLNISGDLDGSQFFLASDKNGGTDLMLEPTPPSGTSSSDQYVWGSAVAGSWDVAGNWDDTTAGQNPASVAPGSHDSVTIDAAGGGATHVITGTGNSTSLTIEGATVLAGQFTTGTLALPSTAGSLQLNAGDLLTVTGDASFGQSGPVVSFGGTLTMLGGALTVDGNLFFGSSLPLTSYTINGGTLTAGSVTTSDADFSVSGGATFLVAGNVTGLSIGDSFYQISGGTFTVDGTFISENDRIDASGGSHVQLAGLAFGTSGITLQVDGTSSLEVGTVGGAASGSITIDTGVTATEAGTFTAPSIVDDGTLVVTADSGLTLNGSLGGDGQIEIGAGADLTLSAVAAASTNTIAFTGTGGALTIESTALNASDDFIPTISGFNASDVIDFAGAVTSASYNNGVLTLFNGVNVVANLTLSGNYAGETFYALAVSSGLTQIDVLGAGDTTTPPSGTSSSDQYVWGSAVAGSWDVAGNWDDTTAGQNPASVAPGSHDSVTIDAAGGGATHVITGTGNSTSLTIEGATVLAGQFTTGTLALPSTAGSLQLNAGDLLTVTGDASFGQSGPGPFGGTLTMLGGALTVDGNLFFGSSLPLTSYTINGGTLTAGSVTTSDADFSVSGGATFLVAGNVTGLSIGDSFYQISGGTFTVDGTFISENDRIDASGGSHVQLAGLAFGTSGITLQVDGTSSLEVGTVGGAASGSITIDTGVTATEAGTFTAPSIVDDGTLVVTADSGLTLNGSLGGDGQIEIGAGADLTLSAVAAASTNTIAFTGTGGALTIESTALNASDDFIPTISGFNASDVIDFAGAVTSASYNNGVLTLFNGVNVVANLTLSGNYAGETFYALAVSSGLTQIDVLGAGDTTTPPSGTSSSDQYVWGSAVAGSWDVAGNWDDTTAGQNPASVAPGSHDSVTIDAAGGGATHVITGTGNSTSLTIEGATVLAGQFTTGTLALPSTAGSLQLNAGDLLTVTGDASFGQSGPVVSFGGTLTMLGGALTVDGNLFFGSSLPLTSYTINGGTLTAGSVTTSDADFSVSGGATFLVAGNVTGLSIGDSFYQISGGTFTVDGTFISENDRIDASGGSHVQLAGLAFGTSGITLQVDGTSSLEVGTVGGAASGSITIDTGVTATEAGTFTAPSIVDDGTLVVTADSGLTLNGSLGGDGQIEIGAGADLTLSAVAAASTNTIAFTGTGGALTIESTALNASDDFIPTISGFNASDVIDFAGAVTSASYNGSNGVLTLFDGGTPVAFLNIGSGYSGDTFTTTEISPSLTQIVDPPGAPATIDSGGSLEINGTSSVTVTFAGSTGVLVLDQPASFDGHIAGISGSGDVVDLKGFDAADTTVTPTFNAANDTTTLAVTDSSDGASVSLTLDGNYTSANDISWAVTGDSTHNGADIFDPPAAGAAADPLVSSSASASGAAGTIAFADTDSSAVQAASFTPEGASYVGSFSLDAVTDANGSASVGFEFSLGNDQIDLVPGQTVTQSYNVSLADAQNPAANAAQTVSVSFGGAGNDNFVFHPGVGADTIINFNPQHDTIELDNFSNIQSAQELASLVSTDAHGDAMIALGHGDSITLPGINAVQLQQALASVVHLH